MPDSGKRRRDSGYILAASSILFAMTVVAGVLVTKEGGSGRETVLQGEALGSVVTQKLLLNAVARKKLKDAVTAAGKAPSSGERAKIQHMLMPIANHLAVRQVSSCFKVFTKLSQHEVLPPDFSEEYCE